MTQLARPLETGSLPDTPTGDSLLRRLVASQADLRDHFVCAVGGHSDLTAGVALSDSGAAAPYLNQAVMLRPTWCSTTRTWPVNSHAACACGVPRGAPDPRARHARPAERAARVHHQFGNVVERKADYGQMALLMAWASHCVYRWSGQPWARTSRSWWSIAR